MGCLLLIFEMCTVVQNDNKIIFIMCNKPTSVYCFNAIFILVWYYQCFPILTIDKRLLWIVNKVATNLDYPLFIFFVSHLVLVLLLSHHHHSHHHHHQLWVYFSISLRYHQQCLPFTRQYHHRHLHHHITTHVYHLSWVGRVISAA